MQIRAFLKLQIYLAALHDYALIWKGEGKGVSRLAIESYSLWKKAKNYENLATSSMHPHKTVK